MPSILDQALQTSTASHISGMLLLVFHLLLSLVLFSAGFLVGVIFLFNLEILQITVVFLCMPHG